MTGKIISHYETLEHVGDHELGSVYEARDLEADRIVCLLLLPLDLRDRSLRQVEEDLALIAKIEHPNLDLPLDHGATDLGQIFICFESDRDAQTLEEQLRRAPLPPEAACAIARQIASGLSALHRVGLCHGFLRPAFVVRASESLKIRFPGLGRAIRCRDVRARPNSTPANRALVYRAPEQFLNEPSDEYTDLWALGGIFYEMLTRHLPFQGISSGDVIKAVVEQPLPTSWEGIPRESVFEEILNRSLVRDPSERFASAVGMGKALERAARQLERSDDRNASSEEASQVEIAKSARALAGKKFSHFEIVERIGGGGMGEVFLARDLKLDRPVALKFLSRRLDRNAAQIQRFIQEAKAASALDHPNICTIHAIDETSDGSMFIAMAYYEGEMLDSRIEQGPLDLPEIIEIGSQLCSGLAAAHERGIIHRDIKPANIMVTHDGVVKILDFGLSKYRESDLSNPSGSVMGTTDYISPEQAMGKEVTQQSDLWALGIVLYEMTLGQKPFHGSNQLSVLFNIVHNEPRGLEETSLLGIPLELVQIIRKALRKDCKKRYQIALELKQDLEALRQDPSASRLERERRRTRRLAMFLGVLFLLAMFFVAIWPTPEESANTPEVPKPPQVRILRGGEEGALNGPRSIALEEVVSYILRDHGIEVEILNPVEEDGALDTTPPVVAESEEGKVIDLEIDLETRGEEWRYVIGIEDEEVPPSDEWLSGIPANVLQEAVTIAQRLMTTLGLEERLIEGDQESLDDGTGPLILPPLDPEIIPIIEEARAALRLQEGQRALDLLDRAIEFRSDDPRLYHDQSEAYGLLGQKKLKAEAALKALELSKDLSLQERLYAYGRYVECQSQGDVSKRASAAIFAALWHGGKGYPFNHPDAEIRLDHVLHLVEALRRAKWNDLAAEFLVGLSELFPDDPRIPLLEGEVASEFASMLKDFERARELAVREGAPLIEARILMREGTSLSPTHRFEEAGERFDRALELYTEAEHLYGRANVLTLRGNMRWDQQRLSEALADWKQAKEHFEFLNDHLMIGRNLANMALVLEEEGNLKGALDTFRQSIEVSDTWGDEAIQALNLANMSSVLIASGELAEAEGVLNKSEELLAQQQNPGSDIATLVATMRGQFALVGGDLQDARKYFAVALEMAKGLKDARMISRIKIFLGRSLHYEDSLPEAIETYKESLETYLSTGTLTSFADQALVGWGDVLFAQGKLEEAEEKYTEAMNIRSSREHQDSGVLIGQTKVALARIALEREKFLKAAELATEGLGLLSDQSAVLAASQAHNLLARISLAIEDPSRAEVHVKAGQELLRNIESPIYSIPLRMTEIRVQAVKDRALAYDAAEKLNAEELTRSHFSEWYLESQLLLEETRPSENSEFLCRRLENIRQDAAKLGFGLIERRAERRMSVCGP